MNEEQTLEKLLNGLYFRPYATSLTPLELQQLADKHNIKVRIQQWHGELVKAIFEVEP